MLYKKCSAAHRAQICGSVRYIAAKFGWERQSSTEELDILGACPSVHFIAREVDKRPRMYTTCGYQVFEKLTECRVFSAYCPCYMTLYMYGITSIVICERLENPLPWALASRQHRYIHEERKVLKIRWCTWGQHASEQLFLSISRTQYVPLVTDVSIFVDSCAVISWLHTGWQRPAELQITSPACSRQGQRSRLPGPWSWFACLHVPKHCLWQRNEAVLPLQGWGEDVWSPLQVILTRRWRTMHLSPALSRLRLIFACAPDPRTAISGHRCIFAQDCLIHSNQSWRLYTLIASILIDGGWQVFGFKGRICMPRSRRWLEPNARCWQLFGIRPNYSVSWQLFAMFDLIKSACPCGWKNRLLLSFSLWRNPTP